MSAMPHSSAHSTHPNDSSLDPCAVENSLVPERGGILRHDARVRHVGSEAAASTRDGCELKYLAE